MADVDDGVDVEAWRAERERVEALIGRRCGRAEPRRRAGADRRGLLAPWERTNGWTLAHYAGAVSPDGRQRLVRTADWDADAVCDDLPGYVVGELGDPGAILAVDETGVVTNGTHSAGVTRQDTGTTGQVDNCQVGVFWCSRTPAGKRAFIDRERSPPKDLDRRPGPLPGGGQRRVRRRSPPHRTWPAGGSNGRWRPRSRSPGGSPTRATGSTGR